MKRKTLITVIQLIVFAALGSGIIWYMISRMSAAELAQMKDGIKSTRLWLLAPVAVAFLLSHWARARRWQLLLSPLDIRPSIPNTLFAVLIGYLVNLVPPRAGEVAKCTVLAEYEKVPAGKMIGTIVAERVFDVLCLFIIILTGVYWQSQAIGNFLSDLRANPHFAHSMHSLKITLAVLSALLALFVLLSLRNRQSRIAKFIRGMGQGVASIFRLRRKGLFLLYTGLIWGMYFLEVMLGFWSLPATAHLGAGAGLVVLIAGSFGIIIAPGGIGLYPLFVSAVLRKGYGISTGAAQAFGWISWAAQIILTLVFGFISLILLPFYNRRTHNAQAPMDTAENI